MKDGGSAFPEIFTNETWSESHKNFHRDVYSAGGMTLRDYFAAAALQGPVAYNNGNGGAKVLADEAYTIAEAMLARRDR